MATQKMSIVGAPVAVLAWTLFSFLCHWCAKEYFAKSEAPASTNWLSLSLLLTITQTSLCVFVFRINANSQSEANENSRRALILAFITHFAATFSTNCGFALMNASSVLTMKLMEPIMSAFIIWCVTGKRAPLTTWFSLVLVVTGTIGFIGGPRRGESVGYGVSLAFISNVLYGLRNVILKHFLPNRQIEIRNQASCTVHLVIAAFYYLSITHWGERLQLIPLDFVIMSAIFHVSYSYISTFVVLEYLSVVSHAVANILKRVVVVITMMLVVQTHLSILKFLWLGVCCLGLGIYTHHKLNSAMEKSQYSTKESCPMAEEDPKRLRLVQGLTSLLLVLLAVTCVCLTTSQRILGSSDPLLDKQIPVFRGLRNLQEANVIAPQSKLFFSEYIHDAEQQHLKIFQEILAHKNKVVLLNMLPHDHGKEEAMVTVGLLHILDQFPVKISQYCYTGASGKCHTSSTSDSSSLTDTTVFVQIFPGDLESANREASITKTFLKFPNHDVTFLMSHDEWNEAEMAKTLTLIQSKKQESVVRVLVNSPFMYGVATKQEFGLLEASLIPHLGLSIGNQERFIEPMYDVVWVGPTLEMAKSCHLLRKGLLCDSREIDGDHWKIPDGLDLLGSSYPRLYLSYLYFLRGRVAVVNNLYGHVLCTLLNIPHVITDVNSHVTSYTDQWLSRTHGTRQVAVTTERTQTVTLVEKYLNGDEEAIVPLWPVASIVKTYWM